MNNKLVPIKEYKVAYWQGSNTLNSKMFDTLSEAKSYVCQLPSSSVSTIMKLQDAGDGTYIWSVLSEGAGRVLPALTWMYANRKPIGIGLAIFVAYKVLK